MSEINPNTGLTAEETKEGEDFKAEYLALKEKYGNRWAVIAQTQVVIGRVETPETVAPTAPETSSLSEGAGLADVAEEKTAEEVKAEDKDDAVEEVINEDKA